MDAISKTRRRSRWTPTPSDKKLILSQRDIAIFRALYEHGPLSYDYLYEFTKHLAGDKHGLKHRCGDLFNEKGRHDTGYLLRPWQLNPQGWYSVKTIVENSERAENVLAEHGLLADGVHARPGGPKPHQYMVSCITASFELAIRVNPELRYISRREIMERSPHKTLAINCPITHGAQRYDREYVADAIFGIEYPGGGRFYFLIEADRRTEPASRSTLETSSFLRKVLQLKRVIGEGLYKEHFGMKAHLLCITVTTRDQPLLMGTVERTIGPNGYMLFTTAPEFGGYVKAPPILDDLLTRPYERVGKPAFVLPAFGK